MKTSPSHSKLVLAFDTNTIRSRDLVPFLTQHKDRFTILIPTIVFTERAYSFLLKGETIDTYHEEIHSYDGKVMSLSEGHALETVRLALASRSEMPFKHHARDYLIAGQCQGTIDVFITYNKKHFERLSTLTSRVMTPEEFIMNQVRPPP